jgi:hypothetical protein
MTATITHHRPIVSGVNLLIAVAALVLATIALVRDADDAPATTPVAPATPAVVVAPPPPPAGAGASTAAAADGAERAPMAFYGCDGTIGTNRC